MKNKKNLIIVFALLLTLIPHSSYAQDAGGDLSLVEGSIKSNEGVIEGKEVRLYATVKNNSGQDLLGTVKFYDETKGTFIGQDQPVSIVGNGTDEVFVSWMAESVGDKTITARVIPWEDDGDKAANNKITTKIYVDIDSDGDGIPNRQDSDDDNDGTNDDEDAFPEDAKESEDSDNDGIGNNADDDDDNDTVSDLEDIFPKDPKESQDRDGDKVGDNADAFPEDPKEATDEDGDGIGANADVDDNNQGPVPDIKIEDSIVMVGSSLVFDASGSKDSDGEIKSYEWDFGTGAKSSGKTVDKEFETAGNYEVRLKATDDKGESKTTQVTISVINWWQSIPVLLGFITVCLILIGLVIYRIRKIREKKKNALPDRQK